MPARKKRELVALGRVVRRLRDEHGISSQEELATRGDLHRNYVGGIERGERNPSYTNLIKLARGLGIPLSELLTLVEAEGKRR